MMGTLTPFLSLGQPSEQALTWITQQLTSSGFRLVQTFDLHVARLAHANCPCPHHGMQECDCQLVVLLVYPAEGQPSTLVLHSRDQSTWVSLAGPAGRQAQIIPEQAIEQAILAGVPPRFVLPETHEPYQD